MIREETILFGLNQKNSSWNTCEILPVPPKYSIMDTKQKKLWCPVHQMWEKIIGVERSNDGKASLVGLLSSCRTIIRPPFIKNYGYVPYGFKVSDRKKIINVLITNMNFMTDKKFKSEIQFNFNMNDASWDCDNRNFNKEEDNYSFPDEVATYMIDKMGAYYRTMFDFVPTVTGCITGIQKLAAYLSYPFNMNFIEFKKFSGMQAFKCKREDSQSVNKMWEFLHIKPTKNLRKAYDVFPYAPMNYKFLLDLGFKDQNIIQKQLKNLKITAYLKLHWARYTESINDLEYNSKLELKYFCDQSFKQNKEHTVMNALLTCIDTVLNADFENGTVLVDTIEMLSRHRDRIDEGIKKEIFHDGITQRTHDNLIVYMNNVMEEAAAASREEPFVYTPADLVLEWKEGWAVEPEYNKKTDGTEEVVKEGIPEYECRLPKNENELIAFGRSMHNCVGHGWYTGKVRKGEALIVAVYKKGVPYICIEVRKSKASASKQIVQALGVCNKRMNTEQCAVVREWAATRRLDTNDWC